MVHPALPNPRGAGSRSKAVRQRLSRSLLLPSICFLLCATAATTTLSSASASSGMSADTEEAAEGATFAATARRRLLALVSGTQPLPAPAPALPLPGGADCPSLAPSFVCIRLVSSLEKASPAAISYRARGPAPVPPRPRYTNDNPFVARSAVRTRLEMLRASQQPTPTSSRSPPPPSRRSSVRPSSSTAPPAPALATCPAGFMLYYLDPVLEPPTPSSGPPPAPALLRPPSSYPPMPYGGSYGRGLSFGFIPAYGGTGPGARGIKTSCPALSYILTPAYAAGSATGWACPLFTTNPVFILTDTDASVSTGRPATYGTSGSCSGPAAASIYNLISSDSDGSPSPGSYGGYGAGAYGGPGYPGFAGALQAAPTYPPGTRVVADGCSGPLYGNFILRNPNATAGPAIGASPSPGCPGLPLLSGYRLIFTGPAPPPPPSPRPPRPPPRPPAPPKPPKPPSPPPRPPKPPARPPRPPKPSPPPRPPPPRPLPPPPAPKPSITSDSAPTPLGPVSKPPTLFGPTTSPPPAAPSTTVLRPPPPVPQPVLTASPREDLVATPDPKYNEDGGELSRGGTRNSGATAGSAGAGGGDSAVASKGSGDDSGAGMSSGGVAGAVVGGVGALAVVGLAAAGVLLMRKRTSFAPEANLMRELMEAGAAPDVPGPGAGPGAPGGRTVTVVSTDAASLMDTNPSIFLVPAATDEAAAQAARPVAEAASMGSAVELAGAVEEGEHAAEDPALGVLAEAEVEMGLPGPPSVLDSLPSLPGALDSQAAAQAQGSGWPAGTVFGAVQVGCGAAVAAAGPYLAPSPPV